MEKNVLFKHAGSFGTRITALIYLLRK